MLKLEIAFIAPESRRESQLSDGAEGEQPPDPPRLHQVASVRPFIVERVKTQAQSIAEGHAPQIHSSSSLSVSPANDSAISVSLIS